MSNTRSVNDQSTYLNHLDLNYSIMRGLAEIIAKSDLRFSNVSLVDGVDTTTDGRHYTILVKSYCRCKNSGTPSGWGIRVNQVHIVMTGGDKLRVNETSYSKVDNSRTFPLADPTCFEQIIARLDAILPKKYLNQYVHDSSSPNYGKHRKRRRKNAAR